MLTHENIKRRLDSLAEEIENAFAADCLLFHGQIHPARLPLFGNIIGSIPNKRTRLLVALQTTGGAAETTEKLVEIIRHFYSEVYFIVPRYAMSAGTIFCMAGDKIIMDYESSLGPIDPQIFNGKDLVPAQGYLEQYEKLVQKSYDGTISPGELQKLLNTDLADLSRYEQANNLTVTLLKKWLVQYKFKNWNIHRTCPASLGQAVTVDEKQKRAEEIARKLGDNSRWHSHGRYISAETLSSELRLEIDDYPSAEVKGLILEYSDLAEGHMFSRNCPNFFHTKHFF